MFLDQLSYGTHHAIRFVMVSSNCAGHVSRLGCALFHVVFGRRVARPQGAAGTEVTSERHARPGF